MNPLTLLRIGTYEEIQPSYSPAQSDYIFIPMYYYDCMNNIKIALNDYNRV
jgi:hypothetical protein